MFSYRLSVILCVGVGSCIFCSEQTETWKCTVCFYIIQTSDGIPEPLCEKSYHMELILNPLMSLKVMGRSTTPEDGVKTIMTLPYVNVLLANTHTCIYVCMYISYICIYTYILF